MYTLAESSPRPTITSSVCPPPPPTADPLAGGERPHGAAPRSGAARDQRGRGGRHGTDGPPRGLSERTQDGEACVSAAAEQPNRNTVNTKL